MHRTRVALLSLIAVIFASAAMRDMHSQDRRQGAEYFPGTDQTWERRSPRQLGMDSARLAAGVAFAIASETRASRDLLLAHVQ